MKSVKEQVLNQIVFGNVPLPYTAKQVWDQVVEKVRDEIS